jgi:hypothetical protein
LVEVTHWQKFCQLLLVPLRMAVVMAQTSVQTEEKRVKKNEENGHSDRSCGQ